MTPASFRRIALSMLDAEESSHMGHPDFRVGGKVFATLPPPEAAEPGEKPVPRGMVKLKPAEQRAFVKDYPGAFVAAQGAWGKQGCTYVRLAEVDRGTLKRAVVAAWRNVAPRGFGEEFGGG